jgi:AraC-like DNA-binding protein
VHSHLLEHQIDYYIEGSGRFWVNDRWEDISDGDLFYLPPGCDHAIELDGDAQYHNLSLKWVPKEGTEYSLAKPAKLTAGDDAAEIRDIMQRTAASYLLYHSVGEDVVDRLMEMISRAASRQERPPTKISKINRAREIVANNYSMAIQLPWVAEQVGLQPAYLSRVFKQETGETFSQYLRRIRLTRSVELLQNPELTIGEVADRCGFSGIPYFSQTFKEEFGISPSEARATGLPATIDMQR